MINPRSGLCRSSSPALLQLLLMSGGSDQLVRTRSERIGHRHEAVDGEVPLTRLDILDQPDLVTCGLGELLLRELPAKAQPADVGRNVSEHLLCPPAHPGSRSARRPRLKRTKGSPHHLCVLSWAANSPSEDRMGFRKSFTRKVKVKSALSGQTLGSKLVQVRSTTVKVPKPPKPRK